MNPLFPARALIFGAAILAAAGMAVDAVAQDAPGPAQRRAQALAAGQNAADIAFLASALEDDNSVVRRTAVRALLDAGAPAEPVLRKALDNADAVVRRAALLELGQRLGRQALPLVEKALKDESSAVRLAAVSLLAGMDARAPEVARLLKAAQQDGDQTLRSEASDLVWPFQRQNGSARERPDFRDRSPAVVLTVALPAEDWRFKPDPSNTGHEKNWFASSFDDSSWVKIPIEAAWQNAGVDHEGYAWYRRVFALPAKPDFSAVDLYFGAVDESAWVWINDVYLGHFDIGPSGWDKPFALEATRELKWGQDNHIAVRVLNRRLAGGIWKPVVVEALKLK